MVLYVTKYLVRIIASSYENLRQLDKYHFDLNKRTARQSEPNKFIISGILNEQEIEKVKAEGYTVEILSNLDQESGKRMQEVSKSNRFATPKKTSDLRESIETGGYLNTDEVESALINLGNDNPDLITILDLPNKTWKDRTCKAAYIHLNSTNEEPNGDNHNERIGFLITGSMHAREWGGSDICIKFIEDLVNSYRNNAPITLGGKVFPASKIKLMLEKTDLIVFSDVNPDGKTYSQLNDDSSLPPEEQGMWWRKNRNPIAVPNGDNQTFHTTGVDINRNFEFLWDSGIGTVNSDGTNSSETFRGTSPFSEPETKNVDYLIERFKNIEYYIDIHSYGEMILYSWGDDENQDIDPDKNFQNPHYNDVRGIVGDVKYKEYIQTPDENVLRTLANRMNDALESVRGRRYRVQQAVGLYPTSGTSDDYAFSRHIINGANRKIYGFTIEFGKEEIGFIPPISEMRQVIKEVNSALIELCITASDGR